MQTIAAILQLPDKCPVDSVQGKVTKVYPPSPRAGKDTQSFIMQDGAGKTLKVTVWEQTGFEHYEGKEIVISAGPKGGLAVNIYQGKTSLSASRTTQFQFLAVHQAQGGQVATQPPTQPQNPANGQQSASKGPSSGQINGAMNGQTLGMAVKAAVDSLGNEGIPVTKQSLWERTSLIIRLCDHMAKGNLYGDAKPEAPKPSESTPPPEPRASEEAPEDDVPF